MNNSRKKDSKTRDNTIKLKEKTGSHKKYFASLKAHIKKLERSDEYVKDNELALVFGLLLDEIDDLHSGIRGSCEVISGLIEDRNTMSKWIEEYIEFRDFIIKLHS